MKKHKGWSYAPYKPLFFDIGDIYICRLSNGADGLNATGCLLTDDCLTFKLYYIKKYNEKKQDNSCFFLFVMV